MKKYVEIFFIALLALNLGCDSTTEPIKEKLLKGIVKDTQGNLLSDVKVFIIYDYGQSAPKIQPNNIFNKPINIAGVDLNSFTAVLYENGVKLDWITLSEQENSGFEIERKSSSNSSWEKIGFVVGNGTTIDTNYYSFIDNHLPSYIYWYRLKIIEFNGSFEYSSEVQIDHIILPQFSAIQQNYPNPFDISTTILFQVRKLASIKMDVCNFKDKSTLINLLDFQANAGSYDMQPTRLDSVPSNGYIVQMKIQESDSTYTLEKNILKTFRTYDQAILNSCPNFVTKSGIFEIKYENIPFGQNFYLTGEDDPTPLGEFRLRNNLKLIIYKPGFKVMQKDVAINLNEGQELEIKLEAE
jgi:hypothetical protein